MIDSFIGFMESADSSFDLFNSYGFYLVALLFVVVTFLSKNILSLVIALGEVTTTFIDQWISDVSGLLSVSGQFIIYGSIVYICRASKLIQLVYLFILTTLIYDYCAWSYFLKTDNQFSANLVNVGYYMWFIFLPFIYGLTIKGLYASGGGKGYASRLHNNNDGFVYSDSKLFDFIKLRPKADNKTGLERVKKT